MAIVKGKEELQVNVSIPLSFKILISPRNADMDFLLRMLHNSTVVVDSDTIKLRPTKFVLSKKRVLGFKVNYYKAIKYWWEIPGAEKYKGELSFSTSKTLAFNRKSPMFSSINHSVVSSKEVVNYEPANSLLEDFEDVHLAPEAQMFLNNVSQELCNIVNDYVNGREKYKDIIVPEFTIETVIKEVSKRDAKSHP